MTESEWLASADPQALLEHLEGKASNRKLRLFACACARQVWDTLMDERSRQAVEVSERFADGQATEGELSAARSAARSASWSASWCVESAELAAAWSAESAELAPAWAAASAAASAAARKEIRTQQAALLRDIIGNPLGDGYRWTSLLASWRSNLSQNGDRRFYRYLPLSILSWHDGTVPAIARTIYEERRFEELSILADALEEAGCTDEEILRHCRQQLVADPKRYVVSDGSGGLVYRPPAPHVRGCWVIDLLLGKE